MKVQVKEDSKKFEPIELTLTIESEEELCNLWHRFDIVDLSNPRNHQDCVDYTVMNMRDTWKVIDELVKQRNLYK